MKKILNYLKNNKQKVALYTTCFFLLAGFAQYALGLDYVLRLTPLIIASITGITLLFWDLEPKRRLYLSAYAIAVGMVSELIGVNTGLLFGDYSYSDTALGIKIFGVPILVGIMWLLVTMSAWQIASLGGFNRVSTIILAASLVVMFDLLLEQYAIYYELWAWQGGAVPLLNYATWFFVSAIIFIEFSIYGNSAKPGLYGVSILPVMMVYFWLMLILT